MRVLALFTAPLLLLVAACTGERSDPAQLPLLDHPWTITVLDGAPIEPGDAAPLVRFTDTVVSGTGGVNTFSGTATIGDGTMALGPLRSTRRAGPPMSMAREAAVMRALGDARAWSLAGNELILRDADGAERLRAR